jgi:hypothetical protein
VRLTTFLALVLVGVLASPGDGLDIARPSRADTPVQAFAPAPARAVGRVDEKRLESLVRRARDLEWRAHAVGSRWEEVRQRYLGAERAFNATEKTWQLVARSSDSTSDRFTAAREAWEEARFRWELYQTLVVVAAAIDAHNLERFRLETGNQMVDSLDCDEGLTTGAFRALLIRLGYSLVGKEIDHIVPRSLGGADHPANYRVIDGSLNRRLGNEWGPDKCRAVGKQTCAGAIAISRECGSYRGPEF